MKPTLTCSLVLFVAGSALFASPFARGADGIWTQTGAGPYDWSTDTNWSGGTIANLADFTASFSADITANQTVNLDSDRTIGNIVASDGSNDYIISGANILTLDRTSGIPVINVTASGRALTIRSVINGNDGLDKWGAGQLNLNGSTVNGFTGGIKVSSGTLNLDFANLTTPTDLVNSGNALTLGGGTLLITGNSTTNTNQTLGNVTVNAGGGRILVNPNGASRTATLTLGSITPATTGTLLIGKSSGSSGTATITTTSGTLTNGIYGGGMVYFNGTANTGYDWATNTGGGGPNYTLSGFSTYTTLPTSGGSSNINYLFSTGTGTTTLTGGFSVNTLKMAPTGTNSVLDLGGNTLTVEGGGLLFTGTSSRSGNVISNGTLTAGAGSSYKLLVGSYSGVITNASVGISALIADNGGNPVSVVIQGNPSSLTGNTAGAFWLGNTSNSFTGGLYLNNGIVSLTNGGGAALNNNTIYASGYSVVNNGDLTSSSGIQLGSGAVLDFRNNTRTSTFSGAVTGDGGITLGQAGSGRTTLNFNSTANTFTGPIRYAVTAQDGNLTVNSLADAISFGAGDITFGSANSTVPHNFTYGSSAIAPLTLNNRRFELTGSGTQIPTIKNNSSQAFTINTDLLTTGTGTKTLTLGGTGTGLSTFVGKISNGTITTLNLSKVDSGTWVLSGANDYNGATAVNGGILTFTNKASKSSGTTVTAAAAGTVGLGVKTSDVAYYSATDVGDLFNTNTLTDFNLNASSGVAIDTTNAGGSFDQTVALTAARALTKLGTGTLILSQSNSYTGATKVNAGTLVITGTPQSTSAITFGGGMLGLVTGTTVNMPNATVNFTGQQVLVTGATGASSYTLLSALSIPGSAPTLAPGSVTGYTLEVSGNQLLLVQTGGGSNYDTWAAAKGLTGAPGSSTDPAKDADPDKDGRNNLAEFAFDGDPLSGSDNGKVFVLTEDSDFAGDPSGAKELILTVAVRTGTPDFTGSPSPTATHATDGITYSIEGSPDLASFVATVNVVPTPVVPLGLPAAGPGYEYRSFSLGGSDGLTGEGFLRAKVTAP